MKINSEIFDRIDRINWFANCGAPLEQGNINQAFSQVSNWEQARHWYSEAKWEDTTLEAGNALTEFLYHKYPDKYLEWNNLVRDAKGYIEASLSSKLQAYREQYRLDSVFVDCVQWDVVHSIVEYAYMECRKLPQFFLGLLLVYEQGHFPCGWDGDYPSGGRLVVY